MDIDIESMDFDTAIARLEKILDSLENDADLSPEEQQQMYKEAEDLKNHCKKLLDKEKEEIFKIAKENNISLDELNLDDNFNEDEDYEDDDSEDEDDYDDDDDK